MKEHIISELERLEAKYQIRILYAVDSGSRAWGFASENSDWDGRFIYIHRPEWYFQIDQGRDTTEQMLPAELDFSGWELKKALRLFRKANPPLMEWLNSPLVYIESTSLATQLRQLALQSFHPYTCIRHYFHMAENNFRNYLQGNMVKLKKYLYVLRPLMACTWIIQYNSLPPVAFVALADAVVSEPTTLSEIRTLVKQKMEGLEFGEDKPNPILHQFIETQMQASASFIKNLQAGMQPDTPVLDQVFVQQLHETWPQWK